MTGQEAPGTKVKHTGSQEVFSFQGMTNDNWGYKYRLIDSQGNIKDIPFANLSRYEVVEETKQEGLF